jgi:TolA-binding protein
MPDARFNLGNALAATGQMAAAAVEFSRVLAAVPNHAGARTALANLQSKPTH